ncbi:MAG: hypothetical protein M3O32_20340 [Actinomycetota bacterium]|nr:hypothetical protein [Actinomycetota bacterium]
MAVPPAAVGQVRFANASDGWAFDPERSDGAYTGLWATHDGGRHWRQVETRPVPSVAISGGTVWAIIGNVDGSTPTLHRSTFTEAQFHALYMVPDRSAYVVATGKSAFAVGVQAAGPVGSSLTVVDAAGAHQRTVPPCPGRDSGTSDFELAAVTEQRLVAVCSEQAGTGTQPKSAFTSPDAGRTWTRRGDPPLGGYTGFFAGSIAATSRATFISGVRSPVYRQLGNRPWRSVLNDGGSGDGFIYVGMTDDLHGVALNAQGAWLTLDGGDSWRKLSFGSR